MQSDYLYYGTITPDIKEFIPKKRHVPGMRGSNEPAAVHAGDDPAFAAAHAFPWSFDEGINVVYDRDKVVLEMPRALLGRLAEKIYIYKLPKEKFELLRGIEPRGRNYVCYERVQPVGVDAFKSVSDALRYYGAELKVIPW